MTKETESLATLKFNPGPEDPEDQIYSTDVYYDLFDGGYIDPLKICEPESAKKVIAAINTIQEFIAGAIYHGHMAEEE